MKSGIYFLFISFLFSTACESDVKIDQAKEAIAVAKKATLNLKQMESLMEKHLASVVNRDLKIMESTLTPNGNMQLILPGSEITSTNADFMKYHSEWFSDTTTVWTFETKILNSKAGETQGMSIVEVVYREAERNGEPYYNRMIVSYDLEKIGEKWYLIKDHASSVEKSTDKKQ